MTTKKLGLIKQSGLCSDLSSLLAAGIPVTKALKISGAGNDIIGRVESGAGLSASLSAVLEPDILQVIDAGERSGTLDQSLELASGLLRKRAEIRSEALKALAYPGVVMAVCAVSMAGFSYFLVPQIESLFSSMEVKVPYGILMMKWLPAAIVLSAALLTAAFILRKKVPEKFIRNIILRTPFVSKLFTSYHSAAVSRSLSVMLLSGMPLKEALISCSASYGEGAYSKALSSVCSMVESGSNLSEALSHEPLLDKRIGEAVSVAEESSTTGHVLGHIARMLENEQTSLLRTGASMLEPAMTLVTGVFVAFSVLTVMSPLVRLLNTM